ncbi:MAG: FGGY-family carbohydrate kinase [Candidatus Latescibacterota bacterium]|nr:FGGY-family carbohydrate kinase [Candidatus Latescibacterota bacterium]
MGKYLGLDSSTQSLTCCLIDHDRHKIEYERSINFDKHFSDDYGTVNGILRLENGTVHSPPLMWAEALNILFDTMRGDGVDLSDISSISGSGQQHGTVYLNHSITKKLANLDPEQILKTQLSCVFSRSTSPIWMDTSTHIQCTEIETEVGGKDALLDLTGNTAFERFSAPQIRKFYQDDPEAYHQTSNISLVSSFIASVLAGKLIGIDPGDASGTNLMDISKRKWSLKALDATAPDLAKKLLPILNPQTTVGKISSYFSKRYGFDPRCTILPFSGDNPCSLIGLGLVESGRVALSLGTSDTLFACMNAPRVSRNGEGCVFASPDGRNYMALICFLNGSLAREAVRDNYHFGWQEFTQALKDTPPGNNGALILPYFSPEITPKISNPCVIRDSLNESDAKANVRAVVEAQAMASKIHSDWMNVTIRSLYVTGGASTNEEILRIYADIHNCPVHRFETTNSAALGGALRALQADIRCDWKTAVSPFTQPAANSTIEPKPNASEIYVELLKRYETLVATHSH